MNKINKFKTIVILISAELRLLELRCQGLLHWNHSLSFHVSCAWIVVIFHKRFNSF